MQTALRAGSGLGTDAFSAFTLRLRSTKPSFLRNSWTDSHTTILPSPTRLKRYPQISTHAQTPQYHRHSPRTKSKASWEIDLSPPLLPYLNSPILTLANKATRRPRRRDLGVPDPRWLVEMAKGTPREPASAPPSVGGEKWGLCLRAERRRKWRGRVRVRGGRSAALLASLPVRVLPVQLSRWSAPISVSGRGESLPTGRSCSGRHGKLRIREPGAAGWLW